MCDCATKPKKETFEEVMARVKQEAADRFEARRCGFDAALGGNPHWSVCDKPGWALVKVHDSVGAEQIACRDHVRVYNGRFITILKTFDVDIDIVEDHDMGDCA